MGGPLTCVKFKVKDLPELDYRSTDKNPRGELLIKGTSIFKGYFNDVEKTNEAFDKDSWLRTGDVAELHPNGSISIIDRAKNFFKLS